DIPQRSARRRSAAAGVALAGAGRCGGDGGAHPLSLGPPPAPAALALDLARRAACATSMADRLQRAHLRVARISRLRRSLWLASERRGAALVALHHGACFSGLRRTQRRARILR